MKIAVCLSGQPRSIAFAAKSILNYFSDDDTHQYDFFCHAWQYNTWKLVDISYTEPEYVSKEWLNDQLSRFRPKSVKIGAIADANRAYPGVYIPYSSLFYSVMISNYLKRKYETENNFRYDYVYKVRYDSVFLPDAHPVLYAPLDKTLYFTHLTRMGMEYNRFNASDCVYYGDSWGMDIASDLYRYAAPISVHARRQDDYFRYGAGTLMSEYCNNLNVGLQQARNQTEIIYRKECMGLDAVDDYDKINEMHRMFYTGKKY